MTKAWIALRGAVAWTLLGWSMQAFDRRDPYRLILLCALGPMFHARERK